MYFLPENLKQLVTHLISHGNLAGNSVILAYIPQCVEPNSGLNYFCNSKFLVIANYQESNFEYGNERVEMGNREGAKMSSDPVSPGQEEYQEGKEETQDRFWKERT